jgi:hypothetical protein
MRFPMAIAGHRRTDNIRKQADKNKIYITANTVISYGDCCHNLHDCREFLNTATKDLM